MGIKGLAKLIDEKVHKQGKRGVYVDVPLSYFIGQRIGFDATGWLCEVMSAANSNVVDRTAVNADEIDLRQVRSKFLDIIFAKLTDLLTLHIVPVFIFDGDARPEKAMTRQKRVESRLDLHAKIKEKKTALRSDPRDIETDEDFGAEVDELSTMLKQSWRLAPEHIELFRRLLISLGLPIVQARHDAEQTAALLNNEGYCGACYTSDSDALPFGARLIIRRIGGRTKDENGRSVPKCTIWVRNEILAGLELTEEQFVDLCIFCGCDYNNSVAKIGPVSAYELIKRFHRIELMPQMAPGWLNPVGPNGKSVVPRLPMKNYYNLGQLNHLRCREIFSLVASETMMIAGTLSVSNYSIDSILTILSECNYLGEQNKLIGARNQLIYQHHTTTLTVNANFVSVVSSSVSTIEQLGVPQ